MGNWNVHQKSAGDFPGEKLVYQPWLWSVKVRLLGLSGTVSGSSLVAGRYGDILVNKTPYDRNRELP